TIPALQDYLRTTSECVSIGGGRFSMGGQTASPGTTHLDLRGLNRVTEFSKSEKWIRVQAGIRWSDIQRYIDPHDLSVKIMQSYANFTVGGALSVNAHGRYMGLGPVVLSVRWIDLVLADGTLIRASRIENPFLFYAAIGGYSAIGVIVEVELDLTDNLAVECVSQKVPRSDYASFFAKTVRDDPAAVFHNGDLYPPSLDRVRAVTWRTTSLKPTTKTRLMPLHESYPIHRYFIWAFSQTPLGNWRREFLIEPLLYLRRRVHWRNYEAGYDVAELEPRSRDASTYVLQEYFVPVARFDSFAAAQKEILNRHGVEVLNISVRHAMPDPGTLLAWAREEVFAFVLYYRQNTDPASRQAVAVWTRELIDAALHHGGTYYLPYQAHATEEQFHRAYPRAAELFELKQQLDPHFRLRNVLCDKYYHPNSESL
ncbi:MAG: FAD-binding oxidoreductase, partial [Verrucomicrobiales bacterium]|nr:FAD-binding oxidoreductase [Verrucomicrobiales bacterium]